MKTILVISLLLLQTTNMLERHLRIGEALTEDELVEKTLMEKGVSMVRGDPPFRFSTVHDPVNGKKNYASLVQNFT